MTVKFRGGDYQQKGKGLGGFFRSLVGLIKPVAKTVGKSVVKAATSDTAKSIAKTLGEQALDSAINVTKDVLNGNDLKESVEREGTQMKRKAASALDVAQRVRKVASTHDLGKAKRVRRVVSKKSGLDYMKKKYNR